MKILSFLLGQGFFEWMFLICGIACIIGGFFNIGLFIFAALCAFMYMCIMVEKKENNNLYKN